MGDSTPRRGYVALLDVLGFSALVAGDNESQRLRQYLEALERALSGPTEGPVVDYVAFSDSIVLTTSEDQAALQALVQKCSRLFGSMLEDDIALRGAISFGSYVRSTETPGVFVAGRAVIDAYQFETRQDWVGIMLAPSVISQVPDLAQRCSTALYGDPAEAMEALRARIGWAAFVQACGGIPFHSNNPFDGNNYAGFAVVPTDGQASLDAVTTSLRACTLKLHWLRSLAPDPGSQAKYRATIDWLYPIEQAWSNAYSTARRLAETLAQ